MQIDAVGKYIGRDLVYYDVDSVIKVRADRQLLIHTDLSAGKQLDLIGGIDSRVKAEIGVSVAGGQVVFAIANPGLGYDNRAKFALTDGTTSKDVTATLDADGRISAMSVDATGLDLTGTLSLTSDGDEFYGRGLSLLGSAQILTQRDNAEINLNAPGRVDILPPGDVQELVLAGWAYRADGKLTPAVGDAVGDNDLTVLVQIDKLRYTVEAAISLTEAETAAFTTISQLTSLLSSKLSSADWVVVQSDAPDTGVTPQLNTVYRGFEAMRAIDERDPSDQVADIAAKLRDGHIRFTSPFEVSVVKTSDVAAGATVHTVITASGEDTTDAAIGTAITDRLNENAGLLGVKFTADAYGAKTNGAGEVFKVIRRSASLWMRRARVRS